MPAATSDGGALSEGYRQGTPATAGRGYVGYMDASADLAQFLSSRRANVSPEQAGHAERAHLFDLARAVTPAPVRRRGRPAQRTVRPAVQQILDTIGSPATVSNARGDYLAANTLGRALYAPLFESVEQPPNSARFTFLDPAAQEFFIDWEKAARELVANLRSQAGRNPYDQELAGLVGELSTRSEAFRTWWAAHNVRYHQTGNRRLHHPVVGDLDLAYEVMEVTADAGLRMAVFTAEPGSRSEEALGLLGSWAATSQAQAQSSRADAPRP